MAFIQDYVDQTLAETSSDMRYIQTASFISYINKQIDDGERYDAKTVAAIIKAVLRVALDRTHPNPDIRDYVISPEVCKVVQSLITGQESSVAVLQGMTDAMKEKGIGFDAISNWGGNLAKKWFIGPSGDTSATQQGFVLELNKYVMFCSDRQSDVTGNREVNFEDLDEDLAPLVWIALPTETKDSVNQCDEDGNTSLHYVTSVFLLPQVTQALLSHNDIDSGKTNQEGQTPLSRLLSARKPCSESLPISEALLNHHGADVSVVDNTDKTALDFCFGYLDDSGDVASAALHLAHLICNHESVTPAMLQKAMTTLLQWDAPAELKALHAQVEIEILANERFEASEGMEEALAAKIIESGLEQSEQALVAGEEEDTTSGKFSLIKGAALKVFEHIVEMEGPKYPNVMNILSKQGTNASLPAAEQYIPEAVMDFPVRQILWTPHIPAPYCGVNVIPSTRDFVLSKTHLVTSEKIYRMEKAVKGRCCIISVPSFEVQWLIPLPGYNTDSQKLGELWSGLGFDVTMAGCQGNRCLTAQEIHNSVEEFSHSLAVADQCAVLCVLSHGGEGYIYGSDGNKAPLDKLLRLLDNERCPNMAGKPKVVVVQACAGSRNDVGVRAGHTPAAPAARTELNLPTMSDFIVCSPSLPGLASYVYNTPGRGSVFLEKVVKIFSELAKEDDINSLMTWVNSEVSKTDTLVATSTTGAPPTYFKQMSNYNSCLTKLLFFFPCPGGSQGQDWR